MKRLMCGIVRAFDKREGAFTNFEPIKGLSREQARFLDRCLVKHDKGIYEDEAEGFWQEEDGSVTYGTVFLKEVKEMKIESEREGYRLVNKQPIFRKIGEPYLFFLE